MGLVTDKFYWVGGGGGGSDANTPGVGVWLGGGNEDAW